MNRAHLSHRFSNRKFCKMARLTAASLAFVFPAILPAQNAPLSGDAFINQGDATNYGGLPTINIGGTPNSQGLLMFDLSQFAGASVAWARLRLFVNRVNTPGAVDLYTASGSWTEAGVNGTSGIGAGTLLQTGIPVSVAKSYLTMDVTSQVRAWVSGTTNTGFLIVANPATTEIFLDSKENVATSHPATLEIVLGGSGSVGPTGPPGPAGAAGAPGLAGAAGPIGNSGPTGPVGTAGATGPTGPTGPVGATGATGPQGNSGPQGVAGATGPTGPVGFVGPTGASGKSGLAGAAGATGATGPPGLSGATGATGVNGIAGASFSNIDSATTIANGGFIGGGDQHLLFFVSNAGSSVSVTLPPASSAAGKQIRIQNTVPGNGNTLTVNRQGGDLIFDHVLGTGVATITRGAGITLESDGGTRWLVLWSR